MHVSALCPRFCLPPCERPQHASTSPLAFVPRRHLAAAFQQRLGSCVAAVRRLSSVRPFALALSFTAACSPSCDLIFSHHRRILSRGLIDIPHIFAPSPYHVLVRLCVHSCMTRECMIIISCSMLSTSILNSNTTHIHSTPRTHTVMVVVCTPWLSYQSNCRRESVNVL